MSLVSLQQQLMRIPMEGNTFFLKYLKQLLMIAILFFLSPSFLFAEPMTDLTTSPVKKTTSTKIVFCNDGHTNPYHIEWLAGFEVALKAYDDKFGGITGYWKSSSNLEDQLVQVNKEIEKGVDILFVNAISVDAIKPLVVKAQQKGIIWVAVHNYLDIADYNFLLGDFENGYNQGLALATFFNGKAKVGIMSGIRGMASGEDRAQGVLTALREFPDIEVFAREPADWNTAKALNIADKWLSSDQDIDAISVVTDTYIYPTMKIAEYLDRGEILYFGHDGDKAILNIMKDTGVVKADILLGARREAWNFLHMAYKISQNMPVDKVYNFHTPLVLTDETYKQCLDNGFPKDIEVYNVDEALRVADSGALEFGPDSIVEE